MLTALSFTEYVATTRPSGAVDGVISHSVPVREIVGVLNCSVDANKSQCHLPPYISTQYGNARLIELP